MAGDKIDDGGPAFPRNSRANKDGNRVEEAQKGMSLRDWFAGNVARNHMQINEHNVNAHQAAQTAKWAYMVADAMLEARKK